MGVIRLRSEGTVVETLGDVVTVLLIAAALIVVPYKLTKAWIWPLIMSRVTSVVAIEPVRIAAEPPDTNAMRTSTPEDDRTTLEPPIISHKMTDVELIAVLTVQKDERGSYRFSANKIADFVGGTRADVLAEIKAIRNPSLPAQYQPLNDQRQPV